MVSVESKCTIKKRGTIPNDHPHAEKQSSLIKGVELHKYQLQTIHAMETLEVRHLPLSENEQLTTEIGVLANKVGSGKSLCVLGLIAQSITLPVSPTVKEVYGNYAHVSVDRSNTQVGNNLIVVPNHILKPVWERYLEDFTDLSFIQVRKNMFPIDWEVLKSYDVVLCNAKLYNIFSKSCPLHWSRVIYDEADSIGISACVKPNSRFVWFVTSSLNNLLFSDGYYWKNTDTKIVKVVTSGIPNTGYIKNIFKSLEDIRDRLVLSSFIVKMHDGYIDGYMNLPKIERLSVLCHTPYYLRVIHDELSDRVKDLMHGNDLDAAMLALGCPVDSKENLISFITRNLKIRLRNIHAKIDFLGFVETYDDASSRSKNNKLSKACDVREDLQKKIDRIQRVITNIDIDDEYIDCPICKEVKQNNVMMACCLNVFCKHCVGQLLIRKTDTCPLCRSVLRIRNIVRPSNALKGFKHDVLINLINTDKPKKTVIFYKQEASIDHVIPLIIKPYRVLNGNNNTILKTLEWFSQDVAPVLFINVELYACGLNLIDATDIIFFQRMSAEMEMQLIGRAYRYGRHSEATLRVHSLLHLEET
jgi:hypothetical protein|tara:strand:- start:9222 stop:10982 length:1761 start_codon:yes stop_codon:yes gene_type:complete